MKILFFIGTLCLGGKERRLIELLTYLKKNTDYSLMLVVRRDQIDYPAFNELNIPYIVLTKKYYKKDITLHYKFYNICKEYKPDIIHTWGNMPAFVSILSVILLKIPHINSQITSAPPKIKKWSIGNLINRINFSYSSIILANSYAGLNAYKVENKLRRVIYNGVYLDRFKNLPDKQEIRSKHKVFSRYSLIMVAEFSKNKNFDLFIEIANILNCKRNDVSFLAVGNGINLERIKKKVFEDQVQNIVFTGKVDDVESLINLADIGLLFSNRLLHGEGISNSIIEYMALGKPVVANDAGGTKEIVKHGVNGFLITTETTEEIADLINNLLDDKEKKKKMGEAGKKLIHQFYNIERMGKEFEKVYQDVLVLSVK